MNIFLRELRANFKSLLIWAGIVLLFTAVGFGKFSAYEGNPELLAILNDMPPALVEAFNLNAFNLTTVTGFFGVMFIYFALMLTIAAALWGSDIVSKEERDKTVEFALTLPVTRGRLVTAKSLAALVNCALLLFASWGFILYGAASYQTDAAFYPYVARSMGALFVLQMIFLGIGLFLGSAMKQFRRVGSVAVSLLLGAYLLSVLSGMDNRLDFLHYLTPFGYFDPGVLLRQARVEPLYLALSAGIILVTAAGAYWSYARRDLYL